MNKETFEKYKNHLLKKAVKVRSAKEEEYHSTTDLIGSFRKIASFRNKRVAPTIMTLVGKQFVSLSEMVDDADTVYPIEVWEEKLVDSINYLLKLYAAIREERDA